MNGGIEGLSREALHLNPLAWDRGDFEEALAKAIAAGDKKWEINIRFGLSLIDYAEKVFAEELMKEMT